MRSMQELAFDWGKEYGCQVAQQQTRPFNAEELDRSANDYARKEALEQRISDAQYPEWRQVFVASFKFQYQQYSTAREAA